MPKPQAERRKSATIERDVLLKMLRQMLAIRGFERQAEEFVDRGEMLGGYHSSIGQEAAAAGACMALRPDDYVAGTHRPHGHPVAKGAISIPKRWKSPRNLSLIDANQHLADVISVQNTD